MRERKVWGLRQVTKDRIRKIGIFIVLLVFFLGMFVVYGVGVYNDSEQYITMHIHREPLYPLFLALFRGLAGPETGLVLAVIVQNALAVCG
ncbi:MAG: hypothetical protein K2H40_04010, partial [Lachnospiraceae bacterium]|nr:hypothetical protein [Lachnospiraceae bacterium]